MKVSNEGLQEEPVEYGVSIPSPQLTQQAASIGTSPGCGSPSNPQLPVASSILFPVYMFLFF